MSIIFTSESVAAGHPDKIADQISDAVVDAIIAQDPNAKVACEVLIKTGMVVIAGEISTSAWVDFEGLVRKVIADIGYSGSKWGFDAQTCAVISAVGQQSTDIAHGVDRQSPELQGAGDQGLVFGYACNETSTFMPIAIEYAHRLVRKHDELLKSKMFPWLGPDAKSQVTIIYDKFWTPIGIDNIVFSTQHSDEVELAKVKDFVKQEIIKPVIPEKWMSDSVKMFINPAGRFVIGGPVGDCGLTGRKIIVDTYGGMARHGGGCFSGKDPSKVDRSAAYMARYVAKNIVAAKLAKRCEVQITYAIGMHEPTSVRVDTFGTGSVADEVIVDLINENFDLTPYGIIKTLDLKRPIYQKTATFGHFGRVDGCSWEEVDKVAVLAKAL